MSMSMTEQTDKTKTFTVDIVEKYGMTNTKKEYNGAVPLNGSHKNYEQ